MKKKNSGIISNEFTIIKSVETGRDFHVNENVLIQSQHKGDVNYYKGTITTGKDAGRTSEWLYIDQLSSLEEEVPLKLKGKRVLEKDEYGSDLCVVLRESTIYLSAALRATLQLKTNDRIAFALEETTNQWFLYIVNNEDGFIIDKKGSIDSEIDRNELLAALKTEVLYIDSKGEYYTDNPDIIFYRLIEKPKNDYQYTSLNKVVKTTRSNLTEEALRSVLSSYKTELSDRDIEMPKIATFENDDIIKENDIDTRNTIDHVKWK